MTADQYGKILTDLCDAAAVIDALTQHVGELEDERDEALARCADLEAQIDDLQAATDYHPFAVCPHSPGPAGHSLNATLAGSVSSEANQIDARPAGVTRV